MTDQGDAPTWIVVITTTITEATMITERLRSLGVPAMMHREAGANVFAFSIGTYGQARVLVPEAYFNQAAGLLEPGPTLLDESDDEDFDDDAESYESYTD
jgi:hypothetical protein